MRDKGILCVIAELEDKIMVKCDRLRLPMEFKHPIHNLTNFEGENHLKLKKNLYQNRRMLRRCLRVIDEAIKG